MYPNFLRLVHPPFGTIEPLRDRVSSTEFRAPR